MSHPRAVSPVEGPADARDRELMARALALAARGLNTTTPNPRVGCVIVDAAGKVAGEGWHEVAGGPHAEVVALRAAGERARGATVYVTLEPCSHHGRTPPCADALIAAGVARVVAAMQDPNPRVRGEGLLRLQAAGIATGCGLLEAQARELNEGFVSRMERGRPWMRLKVAATLDGRTALANRVSQWITGEAARADGHAWRARACAVLTGIGTVRQDDPQLTVRAIDTPRQPLPVIVDSSLALDPAARVLARGRALVFCAVDRPAARAALQARGAEVVVLPDARGKVDLPGMLAELARRDLNEVLVETGTRLNGALLAAGCIDELLLYVAPGLVGERGIGMFDLPEMTRLDQQARLAFVDAQRIGEDLRLRARLLSPPACG